VAKNRVDKGEEELSVSRDLDMVVVDRVAVKIGRYWPWRIWEWQLENMVLMSREESSIVEAVAWRWGFAAFIDEGMVYFIGMALGQIGLVRMSLAVGHAKRPGSRIDTLHI
jgi:hypothetical protein